MVHQNPVGFQDNRKIYVSEISNRSNKNIVLSIGQFEHPIPAHTTFWLDDYVYPESQKVILFIGDTHGRIRIRENGLELETAQGRRLLPPFSEVAVTINENKTLTIRRPLEKG